MSLRGKKLVEMALAINKHVSTYEQGMSIVYIFIERVVLLYIIILKLNHCYCY